MGTKDGFNFSDLLCAGLRVLDAGCGFGMATFALLRALRQMNLGYHRIDAFDLTPAVLSHFREEIESRESNACDFAKRMCWSWSPAAFLGDYDLILSLSMLEYLPKEQLHLNLRG